MGPINSLDVVIDLHHEPEIQDGQAAIRGADEVAWVRICHQPACTVQQGCEQSVRLASFHAHCLAYGSPRCRVSLRTYPLILESVCEVGSAPMSRSWYQDYKVCVI